MKAIVAFSLLSLFVIKGFNQRMRLHQSKTFTLYNDSVVQGKYEGKALSATELSSNYKSPVNEFLSPSIFLSLVLMVRTMK